MLSQSLDAKLRSGLVSDPEPIVRRVETELVEHSGVRMKVTPTEVVT